MAVPMVLLGVGNGMFTSPNISSIMGSVPSTRRGVASAFRTTVFNVGGASSAGLAILLITTGIPYSVFSNLLRSMDPASLGQIPEQEFINGFKVASFVFAIINTCAIIPSFLRGPRQGNLGEMNGDREEDRARNPSPYRTICLRRGEE